MRCQRLSSISAGRETDNCIWWWDRTWLAVEYAPSRIKISTACKIHGFWKQGQTHHDEQQGAAAAGGWGRWAATWCDTCETRTGRWLITGLSSHTGRSPWMKHLISNVGKGWLELVHGSYLKRKVEAAGRQTKPLGRNPFQQRLSTYRTLGWIDD